MRGLRHDDATVKYRVHLFIEVFSKKLLGFDRTTLSNSLEFEEYVIRYLIKGTYLLSAIFLNPVWSGKRRQQ